MHRRYSDVDAFYDLAKLLIVCNCASMLLVAMSREVYAVVRRVIVKLGWWRSLLLICVSLVAARVYYVHANEINNLVAITTSRLLVHIDAQVMHLWATARHWSATMGVWQQDILQLFKRLAESKHDEL